MLLAQLFAVSLESLDVLMVESKRLHANQRLLAVLRRFSAVDKRAIATSEPYYSSSDREWLLSRIVGPNSIMRLYSSSDVGMTKHVGALFAEVAVRERVKTARILHCGDDLHADVRMAGAAGCQAIHLSRLSAVRPARNANAARYAIPHAAAMRSAA